LTQVIEEALREALGRRKRRARSEAPRLPVFGDGGLLPGIDLDDSAALLDAMDISRGAPRR
jgi:hypothetical protein